MKKGNGAGCNCGAHCYDDCACLNADWTPSEVYELREKLEIAREAIKAVGSYTDGCGCCSSENVLGNEKVKQALAELGEK